MSGRVALLVIGASRSGSSALTGVLSLLGATLPKTLLGPGPGNPRGHFESEKLLALNDAVLAAHGGSYWDPVPIPPAWFAGQEAAGFARRLATAIAEEHGQTRLALIKDPRLCRVAPLYRQALAHLGWAPRVVVPLRHPGEGAASLAARDSTPAETAELLQVREMLGAERHTRGLPRVFSRYDALLADWRATVARIGAGLGIAWPVPPAEAAGAVAAFLSPSLRNRDMAAAPVSAGPLALRLWQAAQLGVAGDEPGLVAAMAPLSEALEELDRLSAPWIAAQQGRLAEARAAVRSRDARIAEQQALIIRLTADVAAREESLAIMRRSTSWRVTAPLRGLARLIGRGKT